MQDFVISHISFKSHKISSVIYDITHHKMSISIFHIRTMVESKNGL